MSVKFDWICHWRRGLVGLDVRSWVDIDNSGRNRCGIWAIYNRGKIWVGVTHSNLDVGRMAFSDMRWCGRAKRLGLGVNNCRLKLGWDACS